MRRAVRHRPPDHGVRRPCAGSREVPGLVRGQDRGRKRDADCRPERRPAVPSSTSWPKAVKFDKTELTAHARQRRSRSTSTTRTRAPRTTSTSSMPGRDEGLRRPGLPGARGPRLRRSAAGRRRVQVHLLDPPDPHVRHAQCSVRSSDGDHRADARRLRLPERAVRMADDDRSQEDRDPLPRQLVHLLLPRRHPRPVRPDRAGAARHPVPRRRARLQPDLHDARLGDDLPVHHPDARRLRKLRRAAPDRRAGHGVPADQRPLVLDAAARRHPAVPGVRDRRRGGRRAGRATRRSPRTGRWRRPGPARISGSWA